jgi:hypothetical protein
MPQTNRDLIAKFQQLARWMIDDTERSMFQARANFLVAQALLNYTETIGSFILPNGSPAERFDTYFSRLGPEYSILLRRFNGRRRIRPHIIYDDLRCGLTHEYVVKRKVFRVYNYYNNGVTPSDMTIDNLVIPINGIPTICVAGVMHSWENRKGVWHIIDPKYWADFRRALDVYINDIQIATNRDLRRNFFARARRINFIEFH